VKFVQIGVETFESFEELVCGWAMARAQATENILRGRALCQGTTSVVSKQPTESRALAPACRWQWLKPIRLRVLSARLKSCPDTKPTVGEFRKPDDLRGTAFGYAPPSV
jgi:hypothetical protein